MFLRRTILALAAMLPLAAANDPVSIDTGKISGIDGAEAGVRVYKGIPFAAPPVGDLRWKGPRPAHR
jgi:para-nitrobenzyl esterase